jgi:dTDP-L-rhamnose 4-epimerase
MPEKVLVTGGAGFIGCALSAELLSRGDEVVVLDNLHPQVHPGPGLPARLLPGVRFIPGDVTVGSCFRALFKYFQPDAVVHLAAETGTGQSLTEASRHAAVNVSGTAQLLDALSAAGHVPKQFLLASSRAVYGDGAWRDDQGHVFYPTGRTHSDLEKAKWDFSGPTGRPARALPHVAAETRPNPTSIYGATKLTQEHMLTAWCRAFGSRLSILRLQNVYGPGQAPQNAYTGILTLFARLAAERRVLEVYEDGAIVRDFVHIRDVVQALRLALGAKREGIAVLDVGSGKPATIAEVARQLARLRGAPEPVICGKFRDGDVRAASCAIEATQQALGYQPQVSLEAGLATLADVFQPSARART